MSTPTHPTGIEHPDSIDDERDEGEGGRYVLVMFERRKWGSDPLMLAQLEEKVNSYLAFVRDGFLYRVRPQAQQRSIAFELRCRHKPGLRAKAAIAMLRTHCARYHVELLTERDKELR